MIPSYSPAPRFPAQRLELVGVIGGAEQGCRQAGRQGWQEQAEHCLRCSAGAGSPERRERY